MKSNVYGTAELKACCNSTFSNASSFYTTDKGIDYLYELYVRGNFNLKKFILEFGVEEIEKLIKDLK